MAKRKVTPSDTETLIETTQEAFVPAQPFWEKYQRQILYVLGGLLLLGAGWWAYKNLVVEPKNQEAINVMWQAQMQFERDSFQLALENPGGGFDGFLTIIDKYSGTTAANSAKYYAGVCYLQTNDLDNALKYMEDYSATGDVLSIMKYGILGDIYSEKQDFGKAADMYAKAVDAGNNEILSAMYLKRLGLLHEHQGNKDAARKAYERLRQDYPNVQNADWRDAEKYLSRVQ